MFSAKHRKNSKLEIGLAGEDLAVNYIIKNGYELIQRNFRYKNNEIDIIARKDGLLVFFEIKTICQYGEFLNGLSPEDNLTSRKRQKMIRVCQLFLKKYPLLINWDRGWRMDLLAIVLDPKGTPIRITHYRNI